MEKEQETRGIGKNEGEKIMSKAREERRWGKR